MDDQTLKLSAFSDEISPEPDEQIRVCRECGVTHVELRHVHADRRVLAGQLGALRQRLDEPVRERRELLHVAEAAVLELHLPAARRPEPRDRGRAEQLDERLRAFDRERRPLPGIRSAAHRRAFVEQLRESIHRIDYISLIRARDISELRDWQSEAHEQARPQQDSGTLTGKRLI